jgi:N-acetylglucosaminyl-diphospho-decaprenol L-rhamnosyltransferase
MRPAVAAVVVEYRSRGRLEACLASLRAEGLAEIVVVDNGAGEPGVHEHDGVLVIAPGCNLGYGAGANRGIAATVSELVLVANPDVVVHPGAIDALVEALVTTGAGIAGPRILDPSGARYPSARRFPSLLDAAGHGLLGIVAPNNPFTRRYRMEDLEASAPVEVDWVSGACLLARRSLLEELGGFDESFHMFVEDVDLCWRAARLGAKVVYVPAAVATHYQGTSTANQPVRAVVRHHVSLVRFAARRASGPRRLLVAPIALAAALRALVLAARTLAARRPGSEPPAR